MKYLVFVLQGYVQMAPDGSLLDSARIELIDTTYDNALKRAMKVIKKPFWRLSVVVENYKNDSK